MRQKKNPTEISLCVCVCNQGQQQREKIPVLSAQAALRNKISK